jgi:transposase
MPMLAELVDAVVGVDTHRDTHHLEIATPAGATIARLQADNDDDGYVEAIEWILRHAPGARVAVAVEGTRSYGIGLARALAAAGMTVLECEQPTRSDRRGRGKSDPIDAHLAVLSALRMDADALPVPRADGNREALRILLAARQDLTKVKTARTNRLRALLLTGAEPDRQLARAGLSALLAGVSRRRLPATPTAEQRVRLAEARRLAASVREAVAHLKDNERELRALVAETAPGLTDGYGIGPVCAAQAIVSFSHPGRCRDDAAFASLAGASPLPASSGRTTRHRLNRSGDRQLNRALHDIAKTRIRGCPRTRAYLERRTAQGKSDREIRRCLKRYIARELYRTLTATMTTPSP